MVECRSRSRSPSGSRCRRGGELLKKFNYGGEEDPRAGEGEEHTRGSRLTKREEYFKTRGSRVDLSPMS